VADGDTLVSAPVAGTWLLVQSKPRAEALAQLHLRNQGFDCFAPRVRRNVPGAQGMRDYVEPLFPRYLFVRERPGQPVDWARVRSTRGVSALVRFGLRPAVVPAAVVAQLEGWRATGADDLLVLPAPMLRPGQRVRVCQGPLAGMTGVLASAAGADRVRVLLDVLGLQAPVELSMTQLQAL
jgi:transcriptional antiterminator RfaH